MRENEGKVPASFFSSAVAEDQCVPLSRSPDSAKKTLKRIYNAASNCIQVAWKVAEKKLLNKEKTHTSPPFEIWEGGTFILILRSCPHNLKGGFQGSKGVGKVELKFCGGTEFARKIHWRVAAGQNQELSFQGLNHDFSACPTSTWQQEWNFLSLVTKGSLLLHLETRMEEKH